MAETEAKDRKTRIGLAQAVAAHAYGVSLSDLGRSDRKAAQARQMAMYLARVALQLGLRETGRGFGRNHRAVVHACLRVEEARENPAFDSHRRLAGIGCATRRGGCNMSALAEAEVAREARRVFRKLAGPKARLVRLDASGWVVVQRGKRESGRIRTRAAVVAVFRERGWLEAEGEALVLSEAGRNWTVAEVAGLDAFQSQHRKLSFRAIVNDEGKERIVAVNEAESPLAWLKARGGVDDRQFEAGERLRRDYALAQLEPRLCADLSAPAVLASRNPHGPAIPDAVLAAKQRFSKAMRAAGPGLCDLLFDVCCAFRGLETAEKNMGWPRRSGKVVLGLALDRLAAHYGIRPPPASARLRSWSADNLEAANG